MSTSINKTVADFMRKKTPCYVVEDMVSELQTNNTQERVFAAQAESNVTVVCWVVDNEPVRVSYVAWP